MLIGIKEGVDDMDMASGIPLWEQLGLVPENYADMAVAELPFSIRIINVFKNNSIMVPEIQTTAGKKIVNMVE